MTTRELDHQIDQLVDAQRVACLWSLRREYYPQSDAERLRVLEQIQSHGGLSTYKRAGELLHAAAGELPALLASSLVVFHPGQLGGAMPTFR